MVARRARHDRCQGAGVTVSNQVAAITPLWEAGNGGVIIVSVIAAAGSGCNDPLPGSSLKKHGEQLGAG